MPGSNLKEAEQPWMGMVGSNNLSKVSISIIAWWVKMKETEIALSALILVEWAIIELELQMVLLQIINTYLI